MLKKGDHLYVAQVENLKKRQVVRVKSISSAGIATIKSAQYYHVTEAEEESFNSTNDSKLIVIANLGQNPVVSSIGGCLTRSYIGVKTINEDLKVCFFYKPSKEELKLAVDSFSSFYDRVKANNLVSALSALYFCAHTALTYPSSSKMLGCYEKQYNNICIFFDRLELQENSSAVHTLLHELSHYLYTFVCKQEELVTDWTEAFYKISSRAEVPEEKIKSFIEEFLVSGQPLSLYMKNLDNENEDFITLLTDRALFKKYVSLSAKYYGLTYKDLVLFSKQDKFDLLEEILMDKITPIVVRVINKAKSTSEYSTKNMKEFFAEAIAYYLEGKKLDKDLSRLCERTLAFTRRCITTADTLTELANKS